MGGWVLSKDVESNPPLLTNEAKIMRLTPCMRFEIMADFRKNVLPSSMTMAGAKTFVQQPRTVFAGSLFKNL